MASNMDTVGTFDMARALAQVSTSLVAVFFCVLLLPIKSVI